MGTVNNNDSLVANLQAIADYAYPIKSTKWANVLAVWEEKKPVENTDQFTVIKHIYTSVLNTKNGEFYLDCSSKKIYAKLSVHLLYRIAAIALKLLYHLALPISWTYTIVRTIQNEKNQYEAHKINSENPSKFNHQKVARLCVLNCLKNLREIIRTPMYEISLASLTIAALAVGIFDSKKLLDFREIIGNLISKQEKTAVNSFTSPFINEFVCFSPQSSFSDLRDKGGYSYNNTIYSSGNQIVNGLANNTRSLVHHLKNNHVPFFLRKLKPNEVYVSPRYQEFRLQAEARFAHQAAESSL